MRSREEKINRRPLYFAHLCELGRLIKKNCEVSHVGDLCEREPWKKFCEEFLNNELKRQDYVLGGEDPKKVNLISSEKLDFRFSNAFSSRNGDDDDKEDKEDSSGEQTGSEEDLWSHFDQVNVNEYFDDVPDEEEKASKEETENIDLVDDAKFNLGVIYKANLKFDEDQLMAELL